VVAPKKAQQLYTTYSRPGQLVEFRLDETSEWISGLVVRFEGENVVVGSGLHNYRFAIGDRRLRPSVTSPVSKHDQPVDFQIGKKVDMKLNPQDQWRPAQVCEVLDGGHKAKIQFNLSGAPLKAKILEDACRPHAVALDPSPPLCRTISTPYRDVRETAEVELNNRFPIVEQSSLLVGYPC
jgi:hypothetical protein